MSVTERNNKRGYFNRHTNRLGVAVEKQLLAEKIRTWEPYIVTSVDYPELMMLMSLSLTTVKKMLKGDIGNIAAGKKMVDFFDPIIQERVKKSNEQKAA